MQERHSGRREQKGCRILIVGTGGQGVITAARLLTEFFVRRDQQVVSSQLHGMAQRGGAVQSAVLVDCGIGPALARGGADFVVGLEPIETARAIPFFSSKTVVFMNTAVVVPYVISQAYVLGQGSAHYPDVGGLQKAIRAATSKLVVVDATVAAKRAGSIRTLNVAMLGCLFGSGLLAATAEEFGAYVLEAAPPRLATMNREAYLGGVALGRNLPDVEGLR